MSTNTNTVQMPKFKSPGFAERLKAMLGVDFYRLFHTPMYYIFLAIAAIIPAMVLSMTGQPNEQGEIVRMYHNTWNIIAADTHDDLLQSCDEYRKLWNSSEARVNWTIGNEVTA